MTTKVDKLSINVELKKYKNKNGGIEFPALFAIPSDQRLFVLSEKNFKETIKIITVALTLCFESMNLSRPMTDSQILDLAETIVDSSSENDKISLEDLMLFLQKFQRGDYGDNYESMDIPKFMVKFNSYRDDRWDAALKIKKEKEVYFKNIGNTERTNQPDDLEEHFAKLGETMSGLREQVRRLKDEK